MMATKQLDRWVWRMQASAIIVAALFLAGIGYPICDFRVHAEGVEKLNTVEGAVKAMIAEATESYDPGFAEVMPHFERMGGKAVPALGRALDHDNIKVRLGACRALRVIGPPAREELPRIKAVLKSDYSPMRREALLALGGILGEEKEVTQEAIAVLNNDPYALVREAAARLLGHPAKPGAAAARALMKAMLNDEDFQVLQTAFEGLLYLSEARPEIVKKAVLEAIRRGDFASGTIHGELALHLAVRMDWREIVEPLLAAGVVPQAPNVKAKIDRIKDEARQDQQIERALHEAGLRVLGGADSGFLPPPRVLSALNTTPQDIGASSRLADLFNNN